MFINVIQWIGDVVLDAFDPYVFNNFRIEKLWNIKIQKYVWALFCMLLIHESVYVSIDRRWGSRDTLNDVIKITARY